jgi:hypothetical protein
VATRQPHKVGKLDHKYLLGIWAFLDVECVWLRCVNPNPCFILPQGKWLVREEANLGVSKNPTRRMFECIWVCKKPPEWGVEYIG